MRGAERVIGRVANGHVNPRKHAVNHTVSTLPNFNIAYYLESVQINFEKIPRNFCIRRLIEIYGHEQANIISKIIDNWKETEFVNLNDDFLVDIFLLLYNTKL